jgi:hypothetical protein
MQSRLAYQSAEDVPSFFLSFFPPFGVEQTSGTERRRRRKIVLRERILRDCNELLVGSLFGHSAGQAKEFS